MDIVIDTSAIIAVLVSEPERPKLVTATHGATLLAPASIPWEIGNALSAMAKRKRATARELRQALITYETIPIRFVDVDLVLALEIAVRHGIYAYDAYVIACAQDQRAPILTLDEGLARVARAAGVALVEVAS